VAVSIYNNLRTERLDALMDDRAVRAGVKFKDADLIGIPWQIIIGERNLKDGLVELKSRRTKETKKVSAKEAVSKLKQIKDME